LYNGKELDEETGLYYYGARYYDARVSVWLGVDPLAEKYPNTTPYAYTANNPISYVDPDGKKIIVPKGSQGQLTEVLKSTFGDNAKFFAYSDGGELLFNGSVKNFTKEERKAFKYLSNLMESKKVTNVEFTEKGTVVLKDGSTKTIDTGNNGAKGDAAVYHTSTQNGEAYIFVNPNNTEANVIDIVYQTVYEKEGQQVSSNTEGATSKTKATYPNPFGKKRSFSPFENFWHGVGHILGGKDNQGKAMEVENAAGAVHKPDAIPEKNYNVDHPKD
jgi:RHS repeat-associated protein